METVDGKVLLLVSQKKWDRGKFIIKRIQDELRLTYCLDFKQLERDRGLLVYLYVSLSQGYTSNLGFVARR